MSYLKGVVLHVASLVPYQVLVERCSRKMMAMMEVLCPMDKAYLTAGPVIVDMLDGASVGWFWTRRSLRNFAVCFGHTLCKTVHNYCAEAWYQQSLQNAPEDKG
jgi:hypothetical protein